MSVIEVEAEPTFWDNAHEWKRTLSTESYVAREIELEKLCPKRYWAFEVDGEQVAHCRAIVRPAILGSGGQVQEASLGNVYTKPMHRGKGYATKLLTHVTDLLRQQYCLVTLWSDVGRYYARFGYTDLPTTTMYIDTLEKPWPKVQRVTREHVPKVTKLHREALHRALDAHSDANSVTVLPTEQYYNHWIHEYEFNARSLGQPVHDLYGAIIGDDWIVWTYNLGRDGSLSVLSASRFRLELIDAAHHAAHAAGLARIEVYDASIVDGGVPSESPRQGSLPMYISDKLWTFPGKYSWF